MKTEDSKKLKEGMTKLLEKEKPAKQSDLLFYPNPLLTKVSLAVTEFDDEVKGLVHKLKQVLDEHPNGAGLSAPQIGVHKRVILINRSNIKSLPVAQEMINPVIMKKLGREREKEGCLSIPSIYAHVTRPEKIVVEWYDLQGNKRGTEATGLTARIICHECDHLDGVLFLDYLKPKALRRIHKKILQKPWYKK